MMVMMLAGEGVIMHTGRQVTLYTWYKRAERNNISLGHGHRVGGRNTNRQTQGTLS